MERNWSLDRAIRRDFAGADLRGLNLRDLDLSGFDFTGADFTGAILIYTNLSGAIGLTTANFTGADLRSTRGLPDNVRWDAIERGAIVD